MTDPDLRRHSVTRFDSPDQNGGVLALQVFDTSLWQSQIGALYATPGLPKYWTQQRDLVLSATLRMADAWGTSARKAISKLIAPGYDIDDSEDSLRRTKAMQDILVTADGAGWGTYLSRDLQDFLTTDNGCFTEIVRASSARGSKIIGLMHLDSLQCTRTGDDKYPVIYRDRNGNAHALRDYQVLMLADMPSPRQTLNGVGFCAASSAFETIVKLAAVEAYFREKVTGNRVLAIHIVNGLTHTQLSSALTTAEVERAQQKQVVYKGSVIIPMMDLTATPSIVTIPLAEIPDGFDVKIERDAAMLTFATALGVSLQDLQPLSGQGLGTGTQTRVQQEASEGMGLAAYRKMKEHQLTHEVFPRTTTFTFSTNDVQQQQAKATVALARAQERAARISSGEISIEWAQQLAADAGDLPREFLSQDQTPGGTLSDDEKPVAEPDNQAVEDAPSDEPAQPAQQPPHQARKELGRLVTGRDVLSDDVLAKALRLAEEVRGVTHWLPLPPEPE